MNRIRIIGLLALLLLSGACSRNSTGDVVLDCFSSKPSEISPALEIDLEKVGILMPSSVVRYQNSLIIEKGQGNNIVDIYTPSTGKVIHCFRKGRGPKEVVNPSSFQVIKDSLLLYDVSLKKYYFLDLSSTISSGVEMIEEVGDWNMVEDNSNFMIPLVFYRENGHYFSTGIYPDDCWFVGITGDKEIVDGPDYIRYDVFSGFSHDALSAFHASSVFAVNPNGSKLICASCYAAAFTICDVSDGSIVERHRYVAEREPMVNAPDRKKGGAVIVFSPDNIEGFIDVCADDDRIYMLYSGKPVMGDTPSYVSSHLLVYDWEGNPKARIELQKEVGSISLDADKLYCTTSFPEPKVLIYDISSIR